MQKHTMIHDSRGYWYNFDSGKHDYRNAPETVEDALPYIPLLIGARGLFQCHVALGDSVLDAMMKTLKRCVGEPE